jgi:hypothetical protein
MTERGRQFATPVASQAAQRRSELDFADLGLRTLHACFGVVEWQELDSAGSSVRHCCSSRWSCGAVVRGWGIGCGEVRASWRGIPRWRVKLQEFGAAFPQGTLGELEDTPGGWTSCSGRLRLPWLGWAGRSPTRFC